MVYLIDRTSLAEGKDSRNVRQNFNSLRQESARDCYRVKAPLMNEMDMGRNRSIQPLIGAIRAKMCILAKPLLVTDPIQLLSLMLMLVLLLLLLLLPNWMMHFPLGGCYGQCCSKRTISYRMQKGRIPLSTRQCKWVDSGSQPASQSQSKYRASLYTSVNKQGRNFNQQQCLAFFCQVEGSYLFTTWQSELNFNAIKLLLFNWIAINFILMLSRSVFERKLAHGAT